jgi:hypothetical protein
VTVQRHPRIYGISGSSAAATEWQMPTFAEAPDADPESQVEAPVTIAGPGRINVVTANEGVATYAPFAGPTWVAPLLGLDGASAEVIAGDMLRAYVRAGAAYVVLVFWAGFRNSVNGHGAAGGIAWLAASTAYECVRSVNTGSGWSAPTDAAGVSALTTAGMLVADPGASGGTTLSYSTVALDASDAPVSVTNVAVTRSAANLTGPFDEVFMGFGFRTGTGATAGGTIQFGCSFAMWPVVGASPFA